MRKFLTKTVIRVLRLVNRELCISNVNYHAHRWSYNFQMGTRFCCLCEVSEPIPLNIM